MQKESLRTLLAMNSFVEKHSGELGLVAEYVQEDESLYITLGSDSGLDSLDNFLRSLKIARRLPPRFKKTLYEKLACGTEIFRFRYEPSFVERYRQQLNLMAWVMANNVLMALSVAILLLTRPGENAMQILCAVVWSLLTCVHISEMKDLFQLEAKILTDALDEISQIMKDVPSEL